ncbi:hypothetical protein ABZ707_22095 [Streptomyces sp. NPDC006923]|uniref:hypothetical protein n=1 Tax=Streptomyces sp. NPDC006923 TaxID=3155355 RepID=UPI0033C637FF
MSNITTKAAATKTYVGRWANTTVEHMKRRRDAGQGAIEYVGITILVVAIVVALLNTDLGATIANAFTTQINSVLGG